MGIMMFCILFIYTVLRDTKDAILVNAPGAGAESLAFAKGIGVTASAVIVSSSPRRQQTYLTAKDYFM